MKKLAIIGASYLQKPLVLKAKEMGLITHTFAWREGNAVEGITDYFYPISITEKKNILEKCKKINIDGVISIASDLAMHTVNYIASKMGLIGNSLEANRVLTDKYEMRKALNTANIPCPRFEYFSEPVYYNKGQFNFPVIVKPTDRSGSRGVIKVDKSKEVNNAIKYSLDSSFEKKVIVEEFIEGEEFSVEMLSFKGKHHRLTITEKETTGAPFFVETAHHQPAEIDNWLKTKIFDLIENSLNALGMENGASHSEVLITKQSNIYVIEIGGRMGGDFIGSDLVVLSTGYDFLKEAIHVALNIEPTPFNINQNKHSGIYYLTPQTRWVENVLKNPDDNIVKYEYLGKAEKRVTNSSDRLAYFIYQNKEKYQPRQI